MKLLKLIPAAAIALTAFLPFEANAKNLPNAWGQKGNHCESEYTNDTYYKLQKKSKTSEYGVWNDDGSWLDYNGTTVKDVSLEYANQRMNDICATNNYQPTN